MKPEICAIFAIGPDNVIGIEDKMPWHSKKDFYHYKQVTKGYPCIFGDRTFFGLPKYPLTDRLNIVVKLDIPGASVIQTSQKDKAGKVEYTGGFIEIPSIETAINFVSNYSKIFICGGRSVYKYCLENKLIDTIYLTKVESEDLSEKIAQDPDKYIRFPIDIEKYVKGWNCDDIFYDPAILPQEDSDIMVKFLKYTK
ncbi:MAG: dihydrofolate reductase [Bacilli bacterium]|nr:dihydrofolate reductase [Bacilli bacterium]